MNFDYIRHWSISNTGIKIILISSFKLNTNILMPWLIEYRNKTYPLSLFTDSYINTFCVSVKMCVTACFSFLSVLHGIDGVCKWSWKESLASCTKVVKFASYIWKKKKIFWCLHDRKKRHLPLMFDFYTPELGK